MDTDRRDHHQHNSEDNPKMREQIIQLKENLKQSESDRLQLQASYDEALQSLADSEAKRETAEKELKVAQEQMATMWKELESLHKRLNGTSPISDQTLPSSITNTSVDVPSNDAFQLCCTLCKEKIRLNQLDAHSKVCSSKQVPPSPQSLKPLQSPSRTNKHSPIHKKQQQQTNSPKFTRKQKQHLSQVNTDERAMLTVNVTRTPTTESELAPFKVVTRTTMPQYQKDSYEVYRNAGDFQWLHDVLVDTCPERVVPPLRSTISLDATVSEYQRFLHRLTCHRYLRVEQYFITFLTGTVEELRVLRAKFRPRLPSEEGCLYRPAQGRDTTSGALVATKDYLEHLEVSVNQLVHRLSSKHSEEEGSMSHSFWAIANGEPSNTYLKIASTDLARTCEAIESHRAGSDGDDALCVQNLQSIADYMHSAQDLLLRVEQAVDKFLFWDEEVTICEAVTSSPIADNGPSSSSLILDEVYDDSGVSSVSESSTNSNGPDNKLASPLLEGHKFGEDSISEKWAQASSNCADAKEYLEMMCKDLSEELALFDLRKEQELKHVFLDLAGSQLEKNEKLQGKWYAMKCILDFPIRTEHRAINFANSSADERSPSNARR